jgi:hypothetical protein
MPLRISISWRDFLSRQLMFLLVVQTLITTRGIRTKRRIRTKGRIKTKMRIRTKIRIKTKNDKMTKLRQETTKIRGKELNHSETCKKLFLYLLMISLITRSIFSLTLEVEEIILNKAGADLALVKVKGEINTQAFPPICLPEKGSETFLILFFNRSFFIDAFINEDAT